MLRSLSSQGLYIGSRSPLAPRRGEEKAGARCRGAAECYNRTQGETHQGGTHGHGKGEALGEDGSAVGAAETAAAAQGQDAAEADLHREPPSGGRFRGRI